MTFFAFDQYMFPGKRETRDPVIKLDFFPRFLMMARFAFLAFLPFVLVVFLVARETIGLQLILI